MDALVDENWVADIQGEISLEALWEYLDLWDILTEVELQEGNSDKHIWRLSSSGVYTAKSAYDALFEGAIASLPMSAFGNLGHPLSAVSLCGWLLTTVAGQQTGLLGEASPIQIDACCAIRRRRIFSICS